jgi:myo-inositol-1(or 4)-monophosphatase
MEIWTPFYINYAVYLRTVPNKLVLSIYTYGTESISLPDALIKFQNKDVIVRVLGSIAIELCLVAEGVMDAVIDVRNKINGYDIAGAYLILEEAKGTITDLSGKKLEKEIEKTEEISLISALDDEIYEKLREIFSVALI